jgi:putative lipoic acid-binding regulatory protein
MPFHCELGRPDNRPMKKSHPVSEATPTVENASAGDSLIDYPCDFPVKVIGRHHPEFVETMVRLAQGFDPEFGPHKVELRTSKTEKYLGITLIVRATSRAQLDGLYLALTGHPMVKVAL